MSDVGIMWHIGVLVQVLSQVGLAPQFLPSRRATRRVKSYGNGIFWELIVVIGDHIRTSAGLLETDGSDPLL